MNYQKDIIKFGEVKNILKKEFDSESKYNEKYLKAKVKPYNRKINTNFHNNKIHLSMHLLISNFAQFGFQNC